jgi:broad specificity phosphatase PhoE
MTIWHWVRHGPTHQKNFVGWRDVPADLSDTARIERLRAHLPATAFVVSSDLIRATATADMVQGDGHTRLRHHRDLREFDFGDWDGMHFSDVSARDPDLSRAYWEKPGDVRAPNGESWNMGADRVNRVVDDLNAQHPDAHIIAVAHFGVILTQVQRALGVDPYQALAHSIDNLSVTRIVWDRVHPRVEAINHLP